MRHAVQRAIERGIKSVDPETLVNAIEWEVRNRPDTSTMVERVMSSGNSDDPDAYVWRFRVDEGSFYAVVSGKGMVVTILTQDMIRAMKAVKKGRATGWKSYNKNVMLGDIATHAVEARKRRSRR